MTHDVFICHSSEDRTIANAICATLEQHHIRCWIAPRDVVPGSEYAGAIVEAIAGSKLTVLVFTSNSNASGHVRREIERTVSHGIPVLPFRVEDVAPSPSLEYFISGAHWLDAMTPPLEQHLDHLVGTVRILLERQTAGAAASAVPGAPASSPPPSPIGGFPALRSRRPPLLWAGLGVAAVMAVVAAGLILIPGLSGPPTAIATGSPGPTSPVALLTQGPTRTATAIPTMDPALLFSDDFNGSLAPEWTWINEAPGQWSLTDIPGKLGMGALHGTALSNVLVVEQTTPYKVMTAVQFQPTRNGQFAGLVVTGLRPDDVRLQFGRAFCSPAGPDCVGDGLYFDQIEGGEFSGGRRDAVALDGSPAEIYLILAVSGDQVQASFSTDSFEWSTVGTYPFDTAWTRVGLILLPAPDSVAFFDFFRFDRIER